MTRKIILRHCVRGRGSRSKKKKKPVKKSRVDFLIAAQKYFNKSTFETQNASKKSTDSVIFLNSRFGSLIIVLKIHDYVTDRISII